MTFTAAEYEWRFDRTLEWIQDNELDALVVYSYKSALTAYWTGYSPRASVTNMAVFAIDSSGRAAHITRHPLHLATASAAMSDLQQVCPSKDSTAVATPSEMTSALKQWLPNNANRIGFAAYAPEAGLQNLIAESVTGSLTDVTSSIWSLQSVRSTEQLERLREASAVAQTAFELGVELIKPGETLQSAVVAAEAEVRRSGNVIQCFIGATDPEGRTLLHPRNERLGAGAVVTFEVIPDINLFCPEVISTVYVGEMPRSLRSYDEGIRQCLEETIDGLSSTSTPAAVAGINARFLVDLGLQADSAIRIGHGTGLDNIEEPEDFRPEDTGEFRADRVISIHPNAVTPSSGTIIRGGTVIINEHGCEALFEFSPGPIVAA